MKKAAKIYFLCAILWEAASVAWFLEPFRYSFSFLGWICVSLGILCAIGGIIANRRQ